MLTFEKGFEGHINITTDAWTSPNHCAYAAICIHMEQKGQPLSMLLDIIKVAKVCRLGLLTDGEQLAVSLCLVAFWCQSSCCHC